MSTRPDLTSGDSASEGKRVSKLCTAVGKEVLCFEALSTFVTVFSTSTCDLGAPPTPGFFSTAVRAGVLFAMLSRALTGTDNDSAIFARAMRRRCQAEFARANDKTTVRCICEPCCAFRQSKQECIPACAISDQCHRRSEPSDLLVPLPSAIDSYLPCCMPLYPLFTILHSSCVLPFVST